MFGGEANDDDPGDNFIEMQDVLLN